MNSRTDGTADVRLFHQRPQLCSLHLSAKQRESCHGGQRSVALSSKARYYAKLVQKMGVIQPDRIDDNIFNRYIWHSIKGNARYPSEFVGAHGKGLKKLGLVSVKSTKDDDD